LNHQTKVYIAGHRGMVGSALSRKLQLAGYNNLIVKTHNDLDLLDQQHVFQFLSEEKPDWVIIAAAKVGGILANNTYRGQFLYENLAIESNLIHGAHEAGVQNLLFLGSSCIYPRDCPQPIKEEYLLTGPLESTNEPYAIAKIAGIKLCESYYSQYNRNYFSVMPTNLYGPNDNYDLNTSHVLPALIRKMHLARCLEEQNWDGIRSDLNKNPMDQIDGKSTQMDIAAVLEKYGISFIQNSKFKIHNSSNVSLKLWGTGSPFREFMHVDDLANACVHLMKKVQAKDIYSKGISHLNVGTGTDLTIRELAERIKTATGFQGEIHWDKSKPDGTPRKLLDISRIKELGWEPEIGLEEGIKNVVQQYGFPITTSH